MSIKNEVNHAIFRSMLPSIKTERIDSNHITYGVEDKQSNQIIKFIWVEDENTDGPVVTALVEGINNLSEYGKKHFQKIIDKLNKIEGLTVSIEDNETDTLTSEQEIELNKMCEEQEIEINSL